ncbi:MULTISPECIES: hydantoinase B/oxoprolinase family protein [unclassified Paenibacillus]|uniref:hydantoinase B/oxoprolinase family protein n=1 Tax=unclassified Paenibacillus TaxID=185978 RepID=UPI0024050D3D|nr:MULTISPECIES: hydantoinase B/oxoprolinase family protein [unclassified Paenibacillus]MDF9844512.1 N-methylhydantoinase B [Paenibacillus sp. PastF-2]MDF9851116.1 N-methylhydantoinase B [Paenibacillus sp. PastM-2]MDF9857688.1 N-methylhydantoinase B [Paenibacillus sp. PastF-1]MDH6482954.1 N-methylhydantoinase B [Paenibacillus sp. PastH-2]MDH6510379.1 N-methylhydantoinase B [Paenibacillus sp. PastM-3]
MEKLENRQAIDPITSQVLRGALENVAIEMGYKLARMSYSSIIRESEDFGCALLDAEGQQLCESTTSTPLQSGPIPGYMRGIKKLMEQRGDVFRPGDVIMHNSPYYGASHQPDVGFFVPVYYEDQLIGFSCSTAHHLDLGALTPGSCGIVDAVDAYAEGLQFKAVKVYDQGVRNEMIWQMLKDNVRAADMVVGDMEAQIATCRIGAERYLEIVERYGLDTVLAASEDLMAYSERMMRNEIAKLPDGTYKAEGYIDGFLDSPDPEKKDLKLCVALTVKGSDVIVDLTGTSPQVSDRPINMPLEGTVDIAVYFTLRSVLLDSDLFGHIPQNSGLMRPIQIIAPKGTLVNPSFPAPTIARFCPGNMVADTLMHALGQIVPEKISAGIGNLNVVAYSGLKEEQYWVYMDIMEGSYGGRYEKDGMDAVDTLYANTRNNPIEDIESHYPLRVTRYELFDHSAAAGKFRGGIGSVREVMFLANGGFSVEGDGQKYKPWGFSGGNDGTACQLILRSPGGEETPLPSKIPHHRAQKGDSLMLIGPGGGGYGNPLERDSAAVLSDVLDGYISLESAERDYGVVISGREIDWEATGRLRS